VNGVITDASTISTVAGPRENNPHRSGRPDHREFGWFQFADGASADARFAWPMGIAYRDGHLVVADSANHRIREIDLTTGLTTTLAGNGLPLGSIDGQGGDAADDYVTNVAGPAAALPWPVSVDVNAAGEILFVDDTRVVRRLRQ